MRYSCLIIFLFYSFFLNAQKLQGTVSDESGTVSDILVMLKKKSAPDLIYKFTTTDSNGNYNFYLDAISDSLLIQASDFNKESKIHLVDSLTNKSKIITIDLFLKTKSVDLREVIIKNKRPITIKNDTTTYNPDSFKDGSERVVEDLLRKLPGIEVKESGQILYKGKPIKKMLLDGDDLFDTQYAIGSRNIDINMIDKVQAIDKFNENPLLKGLIDSDDVALNLQLVKGKSDISGGTELGYGIKDRYEGSVTGLLINDDTKGFAVSGYNNRGLNHSPYDFKSSIPSLEALDEKDFRPKKLIGEGNFYSQLDSKYHNRNSNFYTTANLLKKMKNKFILKANAGFYKDNLRRDDNFRSDYFVNDQILLIESTESATKKPRLYNINLFLEDKSSKSLIWDVASKINYEEINFKSNSVNNGELSRNTISSYNFFAKQNFNLTKRIDSVSAFTVAAIHTMGKAPQNFELRPGFNIDEEEAGNANVPFLNRQHSNFSKEVFKFRIDYIRKFSFFNWKLSGEYNFMNNDFKSDLIQKSENGSIFQNANFQNDLIYRYHVPSLFSSFTKTVKGKYSLGFAIRSHFYDFYVNDRIRNDIENENKLLFSPIFIYSQMLGIKSKFQFSYKFNAVAPSEENFFQGIVLSGFRNFRNNEPNFAFINTHSYKVEFDYDNLLKFNRLRIGISHDNRKNNYYNKTVVNLENTINTMFFMPTSRLDYRLNLNAEQFVYPLRTYFKLYGFYGLGFDKNMINESDVRDVESRNLLLKLSVTPKITDKISLDNWFSYTSNEFYVDNKKVNINQGFESKNILNVTLSPDLNINTIFNFLIPNLRLNDNYSFWDFELRWNPKKHKISYAVEGHNLLNHKTFNTFYVSDFSTSSSHFSLLKRYVFFKIQFRL